MTGHGGGHAAGTGRRGATEFPASWTREVTIERIVDVGRYPDEVPRRLPNGVWHTVGVRDGVRIVVLLEPGGEVRAAFPVVGPGVVRNPDRPADPGRLTVADLTAGRPGNAATELLARLDGRVDAAELEIYLQMHHAGEWDQLADALTATDLTPEDRVLLPDLTGDGAR